MKALNATEFKAKCLKLLEGLSPEGIIVTKRGVPIARVLPFRSESVQQFYGCVKEDVEVKGDLFSTGASWNAQS